MKDGEPLISAPARSQPNSVNPRDISYALSARTGLGQITVRLIENMTGRLGVLYRLWGFDQDVARGEDIWECVFRRFQLDLDLRGEGADGVPARGAALVVANHPFGVLDGLSLGVLLRRRRTDFKILANAVFAQAPQLAPYLLPVDFADTPAARRANVASRAAALAHLKAGGLIAVFPAGAVAAGRGPFERPFDPDWKPFPARLIRQSGAPVIPLLFEGRNSRAFQFFGHFSPALRYGLHIAEFRRRIGTSARIVVGRPVERSVIKSAPDPRALMSRLRALTYRLSEEGFEDPPNGRRWT